MFVIHFLCIWNILSFYIEDCYCVSPIRDVQNVKLIIVGMRHANRNPEQFLINDPNKDKWGWEGPLQLTTIGKKQAYTLGQLLRERYNKFLPEIYMSQDVEAESSSAARCQMSLQTAFAGLYPPCNYSIWNNNITWQPIPYTVDDKLLRMYKERDCSSQINAWKPITYDNLQSLRNWIIKDQVVMKYIANHTQLNSTSLSDMADVADNIKNLKMLGLELPDWIANVTLDGYNETLLIHTILSFSEAHQIACANYEPCRNIMSGYWLGKLIDKINDKAAGKRNSLKLLFYASHTEIVLSLMKLLNYNINKCPTSAGFIIEYAEVIENNKTISKIRFLYHSPLQADPAKHYVELASLNNNISCSSPQRNGWCDWNSINLHLIRQNFIITDWKKACHIPPCLPSSTGTVLITKIPQYIFVWILLIMVEQLL